MSAVTSEAPSRGHVRQLMRSHLRRNLPLAIPYVGAVGVFAIGAVISDGFASGASLNNILALSAILAVVAGSQTLVIISGGIDLSIPWTMTGSGILTSYLAKSSDEPLVWIVPLVLGLAALVGFCNGIGVVVLRIPPIVMTLAMDVVLSGAVILYALGASQQTLTPPLMRNLISGHVAGIPTYIPVIIVTTIVYSVILSLTPFGRRLYAVGTSPTVSRLAGVNVANVTVLAYMLSSVGAAIAGMLLLGYVENAFFGMGDPYLFTAISAVVVGGASILGGSGHFIGTLGGALLLVVANALLLVLNLGAGAISIFYGLIILGSVILLSDRVRGLAGVRSQ
jgi:ribose transport system permease protein